MATPSILSMTNHSAQNFVAPLEKRPEKEVPLGIDIPIIDIGQPAHVLVEQITKACRDFGLFQVVNHGVPENLMADAMKVLKEFFALPAEDKAKFYDEHGKPNTLVPILPQEAKLYAEGEGEFYFWKDSLAHGTHPLTEQLLNSWPDKPTTYKEVIGKYAVEVRRLAIKVLDIICQGLGLPLGYMGKELIQTQLMFNNYYPQCPNPSAILGIPGHCDPYIITFVQQDLYALQYLDKNKGQWFGVEPISNAFVVILGLSLNVISNDEMKAAVHRVVTNETHDRISISTFFTPSDTTSIEPAKQLLSEENPSHYRPFTYVEMFGGYLSDYSGYDAALRPFKI